MTDKKQKITKEEVERRLAMNKAAADLNKMKQEMRETALKGKEAPASTESAIPVQNISTIGRDAEEIYKEAVEEWDKLLKSLSEFIFSVDRWDQLFPNNKIAGLSTTLKAAKLDLLAFNVMDIFKTRVKQRNGNKIPTIKEKGGMFSKPTQRTMKPEEIAKRYEIEDTLPESETQPLNVVGTKRGIVRYLQEALLENEEVRDPLKKGARKPIAAFMQAQKLVDFQTQDAGERSLLACLLTPEKLMPKNRNDVDGLYQLTSLFKKGNNWLDKKLNKDEQANSSSQNSNQSEKPADSQAKQKTQATSQ